MRIERMRGEVGSKVTGTRSARDAEEAGGELAGLKVVELSHIIAGPHCAMMLADEGAEVVKVEPPGGDQTRSREPYRTSAEGRVAAYFTALNRRKKTIVLDLKRSAGLEVFHRLLEDADVFITNVRVPALERLGIHPVSLRERYPRLITVVISGFGMLDAGQEAGRAGLAMAAEALSGVTGLAVDRRGEPVWCGFGLADIATATTAHSAILLALRRRERTGEGRLIDLSLTEAMLPYVGVALTRVQSETPEVVAAAGKTNYLGVPYGAFAARDGYYSFGVNKDELWVRLCGAMGCPELAHNPRYATYLERARRKDEVREIVESWSRNLDREEVVRRIMEVDLPVAPILTMREVLDFKLFHDRGAYIEVDDGIGGTCTQPADPTGFGIADRARVPGLGEFRDDVLHGVDAGAEEIEAWTRAGAFGPVDAPGA